jgi:toxin ParE1/3/4
MLNILIKEEALNDIDNIWAYTTERWSIEQADKYYNLILDKINFIAQFPMLGQDRNHIQKNYRSFIVESHLIFYQYIEEENYLKIIRILHQSVDIKSVFKLSTL